MKSLQNINAFNNTPLKDGIGAIYVPSELVNSYKTATNWSTFADQIHPISEYPIADFGTITDSWAQIAAVSSDGTYVNKYNVGDTKAVNLDGTYIMMRIVGINKDEDANGNIIPLSFISDSTYIQHKMNESNTTNGGYPNCRACDYLESTVLPLLEDAIGSSNLKMAKKTYINRVGNSLTTNSYNCKIWIPSLRELNYTGTYTKEDSGCVYDQYYTPGLTNNN